VAGRKRLSASDWTAAAVEALAAGGLAAVDVEPIAARLGTTKGSFYWHFSGRDALLEAALRQCEQTEPEDVIALVEKVPDVRARLRSLLALAIDGHVGGGVELALQPTADHPLVAPVLARVTTRRLGYLADQFTDLGFSAVDARRRSLLAYTAYLGHAQLRHATPDAAPTGSELPGYVDAVITALISG
jgi:AcrR family transcriptional regulator